MQEDEDRQFAQELQYQTRKLNDVIAKARRTGLLVEPSLGGAPDEPDYPISLNVVRPVRP